MMPSKTESKKVTMSAAQRSAAIKAGLRRAALAKKSTPIQFTQTLRPSIQAIGNKGLGMFLNTKVVVGTVDWSGTYNPLNGVLVYGDEAGLTLDLVGKGHQTDYVWIPAHRVSEIVFRGSAQ